jgi:hypothetical protein
MAVSVQYIPERRFRRISRGLPLWVGLAFVMVVLVSAVFGCFVVAYAWQVLRQRDLREARPFSATAVVIGRRLWTQGNGKKPPSFHYELTLKWSDHQATERETATQVSQTLYNRIREGHEVRVVYRIGKSGIVYVDHVDHVEPVYSTGLQ